MSEMSLLTRQQLNRIKPYKTRYNRFVRWSRAWIFDTIFGELSRIPDTADGLMIDAIHLKAHRAATVIFALKA